MTQHAPLNAGQRAVEPFFDGVQELLSGGAPSFYLVMLNATTIRAPAATGDAQSSVSVQGKYRWNTTDLDAVHPGGAAGTYDVWVTASDNSWAGDPTIDSTVYAFGLTIRASGSPPVTTLKRKVGEVDWDGTAIYALRQTAGMRRDGSPISVVAPFAGFSPLRVRGFTGQTAPLAVFRTSTGTDVLTVSPTGSLTMAGEILTTSTLGFTASGAGGKATLALTSTGSNTGLTLGLDTNLYRPSADVLKTDDEFQAALNVTARQGAATQVSIGNVGPASQAGISLGSALDTTFYRDVAGTWRTPGSIVVDGSLTVGGGSIIGVGSSAGGDLSGIFSNLQIVPGAVGATELATAAVTTTAILNQNVTTGKLADLAVATAKIADLAVTAAKIANDTITAAQIAADAVGASELANNAVDTAAIVNLAVDSTKLATGAVTNAKIGPDAVTAVEIALNAVGASELADNAVDTAAIANLAVDTSKLAALAVTGPKIAANAVDATHIGPDVIGASEIAADAVGSSEIATDAVTSTEILAGAVTTGKIADLAVGTLKLADGAVTNAKLGPNSVTAVEIATDAVGSLEIAANAVDTAEINALAVSTAKLADGAVTNLKLGPLAVDAPKIAADSITTVKILDGNVTTAKIADGNVTTAKIATNAVTAAEIAPNAVDSSEIAADAVGASELADNSVDLASLTAAVLERLNPPGTIRATGKSTADAGWLICDGTTRLQADFSALFGAIGGAYNDGSEGVGEFRLPDLRGRMPVGLGTHANVNARTDNDSLAVGSRTPWHLHGDGSLTSDGTHSHTIGNELNTGGPSVAPAVVVGNDASAYSNGTHSINYSPAGHIHNYGGNTSSAASSTDKVNGNTDLNVVPYAVVIYQIKT